METYNKYTLIKWLKEAFIQAFQPVTEEKLQKIEKLLEIKTTMTYTDLQI